MKPGLIAFSIFALGCLIFFFINKATALPVRNILMHQDQYQCIPCGNDCDHAPYDHGGKCPHCGMQLVKKTTISFRTIQPDEGCAHIKQNSETVLVGVRTKEGYEGKNKPHYGNMENAINIPI